MSMTLVLATAMFLGDPAAEAELTTIDAARGLASAIRDSLELEPDAEGRLYFEIAIRDERIAVEGNLGSSADLLKLMTVVANELGERPYQVNVGINCETVTSFSMKHFAPYQTPPIWKPGFQKLSWDDGTWDLKFEPSVKKVIHATPPRKKPDPPEIPYLQ